MQVVLSQQGPCPGLVGEESFGGGKEEREWVGRTWKEGTKEKERVNRIRKGEERRELGRG